MFISWITTTAPTILDRIGDWIIRLDRFVKRAIAVYIGLTALVSVGFCFLPTESIGNPAAREVHWQLRALLFICSGALVGSSISTWRWADQKHATAKVGEKP